MKLRKIFAAVIASAILAGTSALTAFAVGDGEAAYCFDTPDMLSDWQTYGSVEETGFSFTQITARSKNGDGCIAVSENCEGNVSESYGGAYISSDMLGLENFGGCTISMSFLLNDSAALNIDNLSVYSDGMVWLETPVIDINSKDWTEFSLLVPENAENTRVGFTIPTFNTYSGEIVYIDDVTITRADGTVVSNRGDYKARSIAQVETVSKGTNIVLIILLVVIILAIIGVIVLIVTKAIKRYA